MPNPVPSKGDIWRFYGLGREFTYLVLEYLEGEYYGGDGVRLLSFTEGETPYQIEGVSKMVADTIRWKRIS
jgi:hypothetical protein